MTPIELGLTVAVVVLAFVAIYATCIAIQSRSLVGELASLGAELTEKVIALESQEPDSITADAMDCISDHARGIDRLTGQLANHKGELSKFIRMANASEQKRDEFVHAVHDIVCGHTTSLRALEQQVAGMQVNREVLSEPIVAGNWIVRDSSGFETTAKVRESDPDEMRYGKWTAVFWPWHGLTYTRMFDRVGQEHSGWTLVRREIGYIRPEAFADAAHATCDVPCTRFRTHGEPDPETAESTAVECDPNEKTEEMQEPVFVSVDERSEA